MKKLLVIIILNLFFISQSQADNVSDFEIEGIGVGDSLLDHFSKKKINERLKITKSRYKDKSILRAYFRLDKYDLYPGLNIHFKDDNRLTVESIAGYKIYSRDNMKACYAEQKKVVTDLKNIFPNIKQLGTVDKISKLKKSGKGNRTVVVFNLDGGRIRAMCTQWDKSEKYASGLSVVLDTKNYINWLRNKAYK